MIDPAYHNIGLWKTVLIQKCSEREFNAIRWRTTHGKSKKIAILMELCNSQRQADGKCMSNSRLLPERSHHNNIPNLTQGNNEIVDPARVDTVVVRYKYVH